MKVREGRWTFDAEAFADVSAEAKDFISKLLDKDPKWVLARRRFSGVPVVSNDGVEGHECEAWGGSCPLYTASETYGGGFCVVFSNITARCVISPGWGWG